jgi:transcriptional regulator with XRE-family HTH domain
MRLDSTQETIGARVRKLRERQGLTQLSLGRKTGLSERAINKIEADMFLVGALRDVIERLSEALGVKPDVLERGEFHSERETRSEIVRLRNEGVLANDDEMRRLDEMAVFAIKRRNNALVPLNRLELEALLETMRGSDNL